MTEEERNSYIDYRIESAFKTFRAAKLLADEKFYNSAINRLYYSAFYAVNALFFAHKIKTKSHTSTKRLFSLHFIKTEVFDIEQGKLFSKLFDWRQKGDYDDNFDHSYDEVESILNPTFDFIKLIEKEIQSARKLV